MNDLQKQTIKSIVNIFETGEIAGNYASVTTVSGDLGHLSYGRSQASLNSGALFTLLDNYCRRPAARFATALAAWLPRVESKDVTLDHDPAFRTLLTEAAADPLMRSAQDELFDQTYFLPALAAAKAIGILSPLGVAVVYDSFIQGGWRRLRAKLPLVARADGERKWISRYIELRREWLSSLPAPLPATLYRMEAFSHLIEAGNWNLTLPLQVHGVTIPAQLPLPLAA
jgi:chitosanase